MLMLRLDLGLQYSDLSLQYSTSFNVVNPLVVLEKIW